MRSLSSTVSDTPSRCDPSRRVVSKISTAAGARDTAGSDMFVPHGVLVDLAPDGGEERLLDLLGNWPGFTGADLAVVDRADGHDLGGRARQERLVSGVQVGAQDVAHFNLDAE